MRTVSSMKIFGLVLMNNFIISRAYVVLIMYWVPYKVLLCINLIIIITRKVNTISPLF